VFRDEVINSKVLSRLIVVVVALGVSFLVGALLIVGLTGFSPSGGDLSRLGVMLLLSVAYVSLFLGLGVLLSIKFNKSSSALLWGVIIWLVLTLLIPPMAPLVADAVTPGSSLGEVRLFRLKAQGDDMTAEDWEQVMQQLDEEQQRRKSIEDTVRLFSPRTHFENAANAVLQKTTDVKIIGETGESRSISLGEGIANSWQYISVLVVLTVVLFGSCYLLFTRQDLT
jgi:ABC-type transport system involved in multi-copper enzyme maturation permease subunit